MYLIKSAADANIKVKNLHRVKTGLRAISALDLAYKNLTKVVIKETIYSIIVPLLACLEL